MRIAFESELLLPPLAKAITILTYGAKVCVDDIHYDEAKGIVELHLQRKEILGFKTSFWGEVKPVYGQAMIKSLLTIRQVEGMNIKVNNRLVVDFKSCFTVLLGLKVNENKLYLGSVEEAKGEILCQIHIKVKKISIDCVDGMERMIY